MSITYVVGDATQPQGDRSLKIIAHICNDEGKWGSGFVNALSRRNRIAEDAYRMWHRNGFNGAAPFELGQMQMVNFADGVFVANMIAQHGIRYDPAAPRAVDYAALHTALARVGNYCLGKFDKPDVHMPRIGCGLGGGTWEEIEPIIQDALISRGIGVTVYDLKED